MSLTSLERLAQAKVLCIGDLMLDRFTYGTIDRISPEAPIPVLLAGREKVMPGGAGNVAANLVAVGAKAVLIGLTGADAEGRELQVRLEESGVTPRLIQAPGRMTTVKTRFICGGQQMLRVDRERAEPAAPAVAAQIVAAAEAEIPTVDVVLLSDYGKGVLTDAVLSGVLSAAARHGKPVIVDPKGRDFTRYRGAALITPNRKELEAATGLSAASDDDARAACLKLMADCGLAAVLATRGPAGMSLIQENKAPLHIPALAREVFDVSGAGDTVAAILAASIGASLTLEEAAALANAAAGVVVGKAGTATASPSEIAQALSTAPAASSLAFEAKIVTAAQAADQAERWRAAGKTVGFTNGTFDLLHPGHVSSIRQARGHCDRLVVAINSDASVKRYKGPTRPVQDEKSRAMILAALGIVDAVVIFEEDTPVELLKVIKPDVLVKGGQYKLEEVVGWEIVTGYGGRIVRADMEDGFSTTNTIKKMAS